LRFGEHEDTGHDGVGRWFDSPPRSGGIGADDPESPAFAEPPAPAGPATPAETAEPANPADSGGSWFDPPPRPERDRPGWDTPPPAAVPPITGSGPDVDDTAAGPWEPTGYADPAPTRAEPLLRSAPTRAEPLLRTSDTRADPLLRSSDTRADPLLRSSDTRADPLLRGDDTLARRPPPSAPADTPPRGEQSSNSWAGVTRGGPPVAASPHARPGVRPGKSAPPWSTMPVDIGAGYEMLGNERGANDAGAGTPFAGARPAGFSAPGAAQAAQAGTPRPFRSADTGNFRRQGQDTGAFRRIRDTGAMRAIMDTGAMRSLMDTAAFQALRDRYAGKGRVIASIVIAGWVVLAGVGMFLLFGLRSEGNSATASSNPSASATTRPAASSSTRASTQQATPPPATAPARALPVVKAVAWGPTGAATADHPEQAAKAIDASATTSWHSKWYQQPAFPGVGLVFDLGKSVTVTGVRLKLAPGDADFLIRVGNTAKPGTLTKVASRSRSGGDVTIMLAKPAHGRYVELWITRLPRDPAGTYQESVYNVQVTGLA
jgi:F5/8 type C domain